MKRKFYIKYLNKPFQVCYNGPSKKIFYYYLKSLLSNNKIPYSLLKRSHNLLKN